jgi:hypothetical protein
VLKTADGCQSHLAANPPSKNPSLPQKARRTSNLFASTHHLTGLPQNRPTHQNRESRQSTTSLPQRGKDRMGGWNPALASKRGADRDSRVHGGDTSPRPISRSRTFSLPLVPPLPRMTSLRSAPLRGRRTPNLFARYAPSRQPRSKPPSHQAHEPHQPTTSLSPEGEGAGWGDEQSNPPRTSDNIRCGEQRAEIQIRERRYSAIPDTGRRSTGTLSAPLPLRNFAPRSDQAPGLQCPS